MMSYQISRGQCCRRGRGGLEQTRNEVVSIDFTLKHDLLKIKHVRKIYGKTLYVFHIESLQDIFSRTSFDYSMLGAYNIINMIFQNNNPANKL